MTRHEKKEGSVKQRSVTHTQEVKRAVSTKCLGESLKIRFNKDFKAAIKICSKNIQKLSGTVWSPSFHLT